MSLDDITKGMKVILVDKKQNKECHSEVEEVEDGSIYISATTKTADFLEAYAAKHPFEVQIVVNNTVYIWNDVGINHKAVHGKYMLKPEGSPKVLNRRRHPRLNLDNECLITLQGHTLGGRMVNISAGGFAFRCTASEFANCVGTTVELQIKELAFLKDRVLKGVIIRSTDNKGSYIVGGRLLEDDVDIMNYVNSRV
jgi:hypothetical protein